MSLYTIREHYLDYSMQVKFKDMHAIFRELTFFDKI